MAEIYLARTVGIAGFHKLSVVKRMLPHLAGHPEYVDMFLAEARLAARLDHPNTVQVYDVGDETGNYYYAMEYVRGADLRDIMKREAGAGRAMPLPCAVSVVLGMCVGLDYAHGLCRSDGQPLGVVHRDVSLSNVLVSYEGAVKVVDFGVAKLTGDLALTHTGTLKGKVGYMSPEQSRGERLDRRSDVFAIGVVLYELTTGQRLFAGDNELFLLHKIANDDAVRPSEHCPDYPFALEEIVMTALARDREHRYASARELGRDLEDFARVVDWPASASDLGEYVTGLFPRQARQSMARLGTPPRGVPALLAPHPPGTVTVDDSVHFETTVVGPGTRAAREWQPRWRGWLAPSLALVAAACAGVLVAMWPMTRVSSAARSVPGAGEAPAIAVVPTPLMVPQPVSAPASVAEVREAEPPPPRPPEAEPAPVILAEGARVVPADARAAAKLDPALASGSFDVRVRLAEVDVRGAMPVAHVRRAVGRVVDRYRACYTAAASAAVRAPSLSVAIRFRLDGAAPASEVDVDAVDLPGLARCLGRASVRARADREAVGDAQVSLVVGFEPIGAGS